MIDPAIGRQLADIGGMALFLLHIVVDAVGLYRQWWVPGWMWRGVVGENLELKAELKATRETVSSLTAQLARERLRRASDRPDA